MKETLSLYSPHVVILEGNLALNDPNVLSMLDMKIFVEADLDLCLSRRSTHPTSSHPAVLLLLPPLFLSFLDRWTDRRGVIVVRES